MADKDKANLGCLEEDDEFEEFPVEGNCHLPRRLLTPERHSNELDFLFFSTEWTGSKDDEDEVNVWEDNWDDDNVEDDFSNQLRAQLESQKSDGKK